VQQTFLIYHNAKLTIELGSTKSAMEHAKIIENKEQKEK
jgi:hypothetical protein